MRRSQYDLVDRIVGGNLDDLLREKRSEQVSFVQLSVWLLREHEVEVAPETLRRWCSVKGLNPVEPEHAA